MGIHDPSDGPPRARLRTVAPPGVLWLLEVGEAPVTLGRAPDDGTPPLVHGTVSRMHARVSWDAARRAHVAADLKSRHGTEVDGEPATAGVALADGAMIRLGGVFVAYERAIDDVADAPDVSRDALPGDSFAMMRLRAEVARAAPDPSPVLVIGATGTGKAWVGNELHRLSKRAGEMLAVDGAGLTPRSIATERFAAARGGTLFLDEIGGLPAELLRDLVEQLAPLDVRVIATTHRDAALDAKWQIVVPPLSERRGDVPMWLQRLWAIWCATRDLERVMPDLSASAWAAVLAHPWPDNLRGVEHLVHDLASRRSGTQVVDRSDLPPWLREDAPTERRATFTPPLGLALPWVPPPRRRKRDDD